MKNLSRNDVVSLLCQDAPDLSGKDVYVYGIGNTASLFQEGLKREFFYEQIKGYCTSYPKDWGKTVFGKPCVPPETLTSKDNVFVLICTPTPVYIEEISQNLDSLTIPYCLMEEAILKNHAEEVVAVYDLLEDKKSKDIYANLLYCRLNGIYPDFDIYSGNPYFCWNEFTARTPGGVFVDCGAYTGDTIEKYIWYRDGVVEKIYSFEPDPHNFNAMTCRVERLKKEWNLSDEEVQLISSGVSNCSEDACVQVYSENRGLGSKIVAGKNKSTGYNVKIVALDDVIKGPVDFIKADIESFEYKMLLGAESLIRTCKPCLALCIYHNSTDFYSVPLLVHRMFPDAKFAVRHHSMDLSETVLYIW